MTIGVNFTEIFNAEINFFKIGNIHPKNFRQNVLIIVWEPFRNNANVLEIHIILYRGCKLKVSVEN